MDEFAAMVTEAAQSADCIPYLEAILDRLNYLTAFGVFAVIVVLCVFSYKLLRIFF